MTDLLKLAERVEAGERGHHFTLEMNNVLNDRNGGVSVSRALHGSLDAAKALHDAVLPGWEIRFAICPSFSTMYLFRGIDKDGPYINCHQSQAPNPAAAWVAAILRAKAQEETNNV